MATKAEMLSPGQKAPKAGAYEVVGPRGGKIGRTINAKLGGSLPPTPAKGQKYVLVEPPTVKKAVKNTKTKKG